MAPVLSSQKSERSLQEQHRLSVPREWLAELLGLLLLLRSSACV